MFSRRSFPAQMKLSTCSMYTYSVVKLLWLILAGCVFSVHCLTWTVEMPETVSAVEGTCVIIPCQTSPHTRATWYQYHSMRWPKVYDSQNPGSVIDQFRGRTSTLGMPQEGNCSLRIDAIRRADNGIRLYTWINPDESSSQKLYKQIVTLMVIGIKAFPQISVPSGTTEGSLLSLNCSMQHSCPISPPVLVLVGLPAGHTYSVTTTADVNQGMWVSTATVSWRASWQDNGRMISCSAQLDPPVPEGIPVVWLNVSYAPVDVNLTAEKLVVKEGEAVALRCHGNGNPPPAIYQWLEKRDEETIQLHSSRPEVSVPNVWRDSSFSCIAQNHLGRCQSDWMSLNVQFSPVILSGSACFCAGGVLRCTCRVEASPKPTLHWTVNGSDPPASFASVVEQKDVMVSAVLTGPLGQQQFTVSCTAYNSMGNVTSHLPIDTMFRMMFPWVLTAGVCGGAILLPAIVFLGYKSRSNLIRQREKGSRFGRPQVQANLPTSSDSEWPMNKVSVEPSATYSNWTNIPLTNRLKMPKASKGRK